MSRSRQGRGPCFFVLRAGILAASVVALAARPEASSIWTEVSPPTPNVLNAIRFITRVKAWGVGDVGAVVHFQNGTWSNAPSGSDQNLSDITIVGDNNAWAVGVNGTILHYSGSAPSGVDATWTPVAESGVLTLLPLHAVAFVNQDNGWVVGGDSARGGIVLHYNGTSWVSATRTQDALYDLTILASDDVWFCGDNGRLMYFDGSEFTNRPGPPMGGLAWRAMDFPFLSVGWVVGEGGKIGKFSSVDPCTGTGGAPKWHLHCQGSSLTTETLLDVSIVPVESMSRGYAVGTGGVRIYHDGGSFSLEAAGGEALRAVEMANELEGAAVGGEAVSRIVHLRARTAEGNLDKVRVFPNPFDPLRDNRLTFDRLPADVSSIEIFTLLGDRVCDLSAGIDYEPVTGIAGWTGHAPSGKPVVTGSYFFRIRSRSGSEKTGVFVVVKK